MTSRTSTPPPSAAAAPSVSVGVRVEGVRVELASIVEGLDVGGLSLAEATVLVGAFAAVERLAGAGKTLVAGRAASGDAWSKGGHRSPTDWLAATTKSSKRNAERTLGTAARLGDQPQVDEALRAGVLNAEQAAEVSEAVAADPTAEGRLLERAGCDSLQGLREAAERTKAAARRDDTARHERARRERRHRSWVDAEGVFHYAGSNTATAGARIEAAIKAFTVLAFRAARASGRRESFDAYRAGVYKYLCK